MSEQSETAHVKNFIRWAEQCVNDDVVPVKVRSGTHSAVYELKASNKSWFLKIGNGLQAERQRLLWLQAKIAVPGVIDFMNEGRQEALLLTAIPGIDLAHLSKTWPPEKVVAGLAAALRAFHTIDASNCPFTAYQKGDVVVHGDACLPNFIFKADGSFSGCVDMLDMGLGSVEVDLSAAVWSLEFNLGSGYGLEFLRQYGLSNVDESDVERLRLMYEKSPIFER